MARRETNVFSLSFLDAMTCGFGAVVLFYMVINAAVGLRTGRLTGDLRADAERLEREVLVGHENLVELRNSIQETDDRRVLAQGLSRRVLDNIERLREELATYENSTLATREHVNKLISDLKTLEEETKRLAADVEETDELPGDRLHAFIGDGDRQYLTGLKVGGQRILILIDASASMLDETIVNVIRRRNLPDARKIRAEKWQRAVASVDWLLTQVPRDSRFQVYFFNDTAGPVFPDSGGRWLDGTDAQALDQTAGAVKTLVPGGGTSLYHALASAGTLSPAPDNLILITDGLPTRGQSPPRGRTVSARQRLKHFDKALDVLPRGTPVNVILFPMEGDPMAASAFWKLAQITRGSFLSPSEDWP